MLGIAQFDANADQSDELGIGESLDRRQPIEALSGHTVFATQVTAVGQWYSEICRDPTVLIDATLLSAVHMRNPKRFG